MLVKMLTIVQLAIYSKTQNFYRQKNKTALKMFYNIWATWKEIHISYSMMKSGSRSALSMATQKTAQLAFEGKQ